MSRTFYFITHPNVLITRDVPVPQWPLSQVGRARMKVALGQTWISDISAVYCSTERKAIDGAEILGAHLCLNANEVPDLGENDRSATGFLPPHEFEAVADEFFSSPMQSVRGWETAANAQARVVNAVGAIARLDPSNGSIAIVSHGAVGTLLYCALSGNPISRQWDQPANSGGNYYAFQLEPQRTFSWWKPIDEIAPQI